MQEATGTIVACVCKVPSITVEDASMLQDKLVASIIPQDYKKLILEAIDKKVIVVCCMGTFVNKSIGIGSHKTKTITHQQVQDEIQ